MDLLNSYQFVYDESVKLMSENPNEIPWNCSQIYVFGQGDDFLQRLEWVRILIMTKFYENFYQRYVFVD